MKEIKRKVQVEREPGVVFELISDLRRRPEWVTTTVQTYDVPPGTMRDGQCFRQTMRVAGKQIESKWSVARIEPQRRIEYDVNCSAGGRLSMTQSLIALGEATVVEIVAEYELPLDLLRGPLWARYIERRIQREVAVSLHNLRDLLELQTAP
jgi:uncharacterized protein YndB with AHSA1/START domain